MFRIPKARGVSLSTVVGFALACALTVFSGGTAPAETVNLDENPMNGDESSVTTTVIGSNPVAVENVITNNTGEAFTFDWPGAGPGGFSSVLNPGPNVGTIWQWTTYANLYTIESEVRFSPDPLEIPVFGVPGGGVQVPGADLVFTVPGKTVFPNGDLTVSTASLNSSLITFFSPPQTIATCNSTFVPGRFEQVIANDSPDPITVTVEEVDCCEEPLQTLCEDGCAFYFDDEENCGGCGIECAEGATCVLGCCTGTSNCNGACSDLQTDPQNCGGCGIACEEGASCFDGVCEELCAGTLCDDVCVDLGSDAENCGACGNVCPAEVDCIEGVCDCPEDGTQCGDVCTDLDWDSENCGACGNVCPVDAYCDLGSCQCIEGMEECDGVCTDIWNDDENCGECGNVCPEDSYCTGEDCECFEGLTLCEDGCANTLFDTENCGGCGFACDFTECPTGTGYCGEGTCECDEVGAPPGAPQSMTSGSPEDTGARGRGRSGVARVARKSELRTPRRDRARAAAVRETGRRELEAPVSGSLSFGQMLPGGRFGRADGSLRSRAGVEAIPTGPIVRPDLLQSVDRFWGGTEASTLPGCSLIDFEGLDNGETVGTIPGTPNTTFGPAWTALIDSDAGGTGNFANEPSPDTAVTFLYFAEGDFLTRNSADPSGNSDALKDWLADIGIVEDRIEHTVDFETGFTNGQNVSGLAGLFPGGMVITDTGAGSPAAIVRSTGFGGSNPVGALALAHDEDAFLDLEFYARPVDYVAFQDIDQAGTVGLVEFEDGSSEPISFETTGTGGNSAEFFGIFRNGRERIVRVRLDASGDGQWGIDTIRYGRIPADPIDFDEGVQFVEVFYTAAAVSLPVVMNAWDGPGGTGNLVDSVVGNTLGTSPEGADCVGDPEGQFCLWDVLQLTSEANTIRSITLEGAAENAFGFDNMTFCVDVPETGACCDDGTCVVTTSANCASLGGTYQGDGAPCEADTCGPPFIVGVQDAPICTFEPVEEEVLEPGDEIVICTQGIRGGKEVFTQATVLDDDGSVFGRGPCALIVPDDDLAIADFVPSQFAVRLFDDSGDYLPQPGESFSLQVEVLNLGINQLLGPTAQLSSPPDFFNPLPVNFIQGQAAYPNFPDLTDSDLATCGDEEPNFQPQTNLVPFVVELPAYQASDVSRLFRLEIQGTVPGVGPIVESMPISIGVGKTCDPLGGGDSPEYDGIVGFVAPVGAVLAPPDYPVNLSTGSFTAGDDVPLRFELRCGAVASDPARFDPPPSIGSIVHDTLGELPLTDINADDPGNPSNPFFSCGASDCFFNLSTAQIPAGEIVIQVIMPNSRRFQAGLTLSN